MEKFIIVKSIDKANHFIVGYLLYFFSFILIGTYWSIPLVIVIAALKEVIDFYNEKKYDWKDFAYTVAGIIPAFLIKIL